MKTRVSLKYFATDCLWKPFIDSNLHQTPSNLISLTILVTVRPSTFFQFICFYFIYIWLKITHLHKKNICIATVITELIDVNSVTEQEMQSFPNQFLKSIWTSWQTHTQTHICTNIHQSTTPRNASIPVQWVFLCSLYKTYMLQIYFTKPDIAKAPIF